MYQHTHVHKLQSRYLHLKLPGNGKPTFYEVFGIFFPGLFAAIFVGIYVCMCFLLYFEIDFFQTHTMRLLSFILIE